MLMDATVEQRDGFRFMYVLPLAADRVLVEDTYFSDGIELDAAASRGAIADYVAARGWTVAAVDREETGVLPLPLRGSQRARRRAADRGLRRRLVSSGDRLLVSDRRAARRCDRARRGSRRSSRALTRKQARVRAAAQPHAVPLVRARPALSRARAVLSACPSRRCGGSTRSSSPRSIARGSSSVVRRADCRCTAMLGGTRDEARRARRRCHRRSPLIERAFAPRRHELARSARCRRRCGNDALRRSRGRVPRAPGQGVCARRSSARAGSSAAAPASRPDRLAGVLELLHAGSLIVDDVEDAADERRGGPALHHLIGMPLAINTGSWMYFVALARARRARATARSPLAVAHARPLPPGPGARSRVDDRRPAIAPACLRVVATVTRLKTGALCRFAAELGAIAARRGSRRLRARSAAFGEQMGMRAADARRPRSADVAGAPRQGARRSARWRGRPGRGPGSPRDRVAWDALHRDSRDLDDARDDARRRDRASVGRARIRATLDAALARRCARRSARARAIDAHRRRARAHGG